ncbi:MULTISPECIES: hypothetical protein [Streptomyces violaceusniger group]|uniref:Uncharacterized protein n=1 Tax=Streptomyces antimycoticus TaxID=68175 RepID=A0ABD5JKI1_9ACTN|nr:hypothetical protein [Streptomyces violaceusniger]MEE4588057.1 hypothetical protein [Streptomyces sp. DSM 41602]
MSTQQSSFLLIGTDDREFSVNKLKVAGIPYRRKSLYSHPQNWERIIQLLEDPSLTAVLGKLTPPLFRIIAGSRGHADVAQRLFEALGKKPHMIFIHASALDGDENDDYSPAHEDEDPHVHETYVDWLRRTSFAPPSEEIKNTVLALLDAAKVSLTSYSTNAEMSTLSGSFIDDYESNLLFRVYVPKGRLYAAEADRLLALFHDWLTQVGRHSVRQDGYSTAAGRVYEFFGDATLLPQEMSQQFNEFSNFLDLCASDPDAAEDELSNKGLARTSATDIVTRYGRSVRRINTDLRHERETRMLAIRHRLESELLDISEGEYADSADLDSFVNSLTPNPSAANTFGAISPTSAPPVTSGTTINVNQQIFQNLRGTVIQNVQGTVHLGPEAKELLQLIASHGGTEAGDLESAVHELEDSDARQAERLGAKAKLGAFLMRLRDTVEAAGLATLQKYLESKLGA